MKIIEITEEKANILTDTIAKIVSEYSNSDNVDAVYINNYIDKENENMQPTIDIVLIYNSLAYQKSVNIDAMDNLAKKAFVETGIKITSIAWDNKYFISTPITDQKMIAIGDLLNGKIVFDRNEKYKKLKEEFLGYIELHHFMYNNLFEFEPPLQLIKK